MVLKDQTGWKLRRTQWTGTTEQLIEDLESAYDNAPNMFSIRIHHGGKFRRYPSRVYVSGHQDIFDIVNIDMFTIVALNMMVVKLGYTGESEPLFYNYLRPLTSLDEGLYALSWEEDVRCLATLVRSFKLIEVYIEHGVTALNCYIRPPRFRATIEDISDEPGSIAANITEKMLLFTSHEYMNQLRNLCMPDCMLTPPTDEFVITYTQLSSVIDDVMRQLSFEETELDEEAGFADVTGSGVKSSGLSHDESFKVDDLELNLNEPVNLNVSQVETQSELPVSEEPDVGRTQEPVLVEVSIQEPIMADDITQEPIVAEVSTQEPIVAEVSTKVPIVEEVRTHDFSVEDVVLEDYMSYGEDVAQYNGEFNESAHRDGQFFFDDEGIDTEYDVQSSEDAGTDDDDDDDDVDEYFLVDEENEIVEPDVDDVDVINPDVFDSDHGNDEETNYKKRRLAELRTEMEGVINASGQWKYSFYTGQKCSTPKEATNRVYLHSIESRRNLKLYKNDGVRVRARCDGKVLVFTMSHGDGPTGPNCGMEPRPSGSSGPTTRSKKRKNTGTNADSQASSSGLDAHNKGDLYHWV
ncbi:hypothetical protein Tco_1281691, partial [Tanacetum coccineum]